MSALQQAKLLALEMTGLSKDALHVHVGLLVFFGSALLLRSSLAKPRPWLVAALVTIVGELWDLGDNLLGGSPMLIAEHWHDVWNTMLWPTAILLLANWTSVLSRR